VDLAWLSDMDPFASETDDDLDELEQDIVHVIDQDLGSNPDDPTRGLGVGNSSSKALAQNPASITQAAENEVQKDDRVDSCSAMISVDASTGIVTLDLTIQVNDDILQPSIPAGGP
jgi:hypothetical protein